MANMLKSPFKSTKVLILEDENQRYSLEVDPADYERAHDGKLAQKTCPKHVSNVRIKLILVNKF
jgi:hypothetical protein